MATAWPPETRSSAEVVGKMSRADASKAPRAADWSWRSDAKDASPSSASTSRWRAAVPCCSRLAWAENSSTSAASSGACRDGWWPSCAIAARCYPAHMRRRGTEPRCPMDSSGVYGWGSIQRANAGAAARCGAARRSRNHV